MIHINFRLYLWDYVTKGGNQHTILVKERAETLVVASKKIGKEVNADRTKYVIMYREQNAGRSHSIKIYSSPFKSVEEFKYLGTTLTYQILLRKKLREY